MNFKIKIKLLIFPSLLMIMISVLTADVFGYENRVPHYLNSHEIKLNEEQRKNFIYVFADSLFHHVVSEKERIKYLAKMIQKKHEFEKYKKNNPSDQINGDLFHQLREEAEDASLIPIFQNESKDPLPEFHELHKAIISKLRDLQELHGYVLSHDGIDANDFCNGYIHNTNAIKVGDTTVIIRLWDAESG
jgi:hypothetical protein